MSSPMEPQLQSPGKGLPWPEQQIAFYLSRFQVWVGKSEQFTQKFMTERSRIEELVQSTAPDHLSRRVLIARPIGMEDSSRYWSVLMTLDHLRIVNHGIATILKGILSGKAPAGKANTAAVKPSPDVTPEVITPYEESCDVLLSVLAHSSQVDPGLTYEHPWFGPMNFKAWHALSGTHMGIHRGQIERIRRGLV